LHACRSTLEDPPQFLIEQGVLDRELFEAKNLAFYEQYKAGTLDIHEFLDFQLKPLSRHARKVLDAWHEEFMRRGTELEFVIMVIAVSCVKLLSAHNSTQHTSRKHKV
jgi:hypothetical protein